MELKLINSKKKIEIADAVFTKDFNEALVHQIVTAYMAGGRAGTKAQKTRAEVRGGGAKPWKQKGTGRARAGTIRSPIWRKGGVTFAAKPRCFKQKVNKKMYRGAICSIFSELVRQERLIITDQITVDQPKTKLFIKKLNEMNITGRVLVITGEVDENLYLAARNLPGVEIRDPGAAMTDPVSLISADKVLITEVALKEIEGLLT